MASPVEATEVELLSLEEETELSLEIEVELVEDVVGGALLDEDEAATMDDGIAPVLESADDVDELVEAAAAGVDVLVVLSIEVVVVEVLVEVSVELIVDEGELVRVSVTVIVANPVVVASNVVKV